MGSTDHFAQQQFGEANVPKGSITTEIGCPLNVCFSRKRTHRCAVLSNALGHEETHAPQHDRTVKQVTDLPIEACYRLIQCA